MSDITKKIFSIEPEQASPESKAPISDIIRPVLADKPELRGPSSQEDVPKFVTRESIRPLSSPPQVLFDDDGKGSRAAGWIILGFGVLYMIGAGMFFGLSLLKESAELFTYAGFVSLLMLPVILLFLLWRALCHLNDVSQSNARYAKAAEVLVTPDAEALSRTQTLAGGIQAQISKVNTNLADTVEALKGVQIAVSRESQALDAAGLQLSSRSEDVGRSLTLQRQALESISGTFDTRMETLSSQISNTSQSLESTCTTAETKLLKVGESLQLASGMMNQAVTDSASRISEKITEIGEVTRTLDSTATALRDDLSASTQELAVTDAALVEKAQSLQSLNVDTQGKINDLRSTITDGQEMLAELHHAAEIRKSSVQSYYGELSSQLKQSEDDTLAAQGKTARMVESNLAQMRRDFARMETDLQSLQSKLRNLRTAAPAAVEAAIETDAQSSRLNLMPLDSDFPPVEPPRHIEPEKERGIPETPLNLGMDLEVEAADSALTNFEPDVIRRPGQISNSTKSKGFGRRADKEDKSGWRWRDMLGTLERPDREQDSAPMMPSAPAFVAPALEMVLPEPTPQKKVNPAAILTALQLSPSAIVDEGTVIDATQARINKGEAGLISIVSVKLPEAVSHLRQIMAEDAEVAGDLQHFTTEFSNMIGNTPPTAPALRAALGSPDGRAYLLCAAAIKG